ncbi:MAG: ornithine carbamoyltransferase [Kiritimatiellia bacterium]|nr:ornithine carbamoyltransferase [Kiritimatiellia bacterium]
MSSSNKKVNLKGRSLLKLTDLSDSELIYLIDLADRLKERKKRHAQENSLFRKNIALIFEKPSTRTRSACTVAAVDEGASVEYMDIKDLHLGKKESIKDSARVLGRMFDGIMFRGFRRETIETFAEYAGIPVWNGLTDDSHPTQTLADLMTIREYFHGLRGLKVVYIGDGRNNVCISLMMGCAKTGINFVDCTPQELMPDAQILNKATAIAQEHDCSLAISHDPETAVQNAQVIYTDVWISMGEEKKFDERIKQLKPYQVNMDLMRKTGLLKNDGVIFLHCLPAFHNNETEVTGKIGALEVTDEVFEAPFSRVFEQAENRLHTIKAIMVATLADGERKR